jgi:hypothetical protein
MINVSRKIYSNRSTKNLKIAPGVVMPYTVYISDEPKLDSRDGFYFFYAYATTGFEDFIILWPAILLMDYKTNCVKGHKLYKSIYSIVMYAELINLGIDYLVSECMGNNLHQGE